MGGRSSDAAVGSDLAGYRIEELIGRGGMGAVYRAEELTLGRKVALKVIAPELAQDERFRERFLRESQVAASLDHPHIVPIFRAGDEDGVLFLAMRYVEGRDLARVVAEEGALDPRRAVEVLSQVADALDAAHEKGLVHRDVKPSNILVTRAAGKEHCYLADFGLTKRTGSLSGVSAAGDIVGTLEYVAPEQITGDPLDERSDVYSLGCVLYECLTGQPPFPRATDVALLWAHVHDELPRPSQLRPELPRPLDAVLARALAKDPGRRYRSAGELVAAARAALGLGEPGTAAASRSRVVLAAAAALVLLLLAALAALAFTRGEDGLSAISPNSVGVIDPGSNELVAEVAVGLDPDSIAVGEGGVWIASVADETIARIDPETRSRVATIPVDDYPSDIAVGAGSVWVALGATFQLRRIEPEFNEIDRPINVIARAGTAIPGRQLTHIAVGAGGVWYKWGPSSVERVDIATRRPRHAGADDFQLVFQNGLTTEFSDVAFGFGSLWLTNRAGGSVTEFDPATDRVAGQTTVGKAPGAIAAGPRSLWTANFDDDTVSRIDVPEPGSGQGATVETFPVGDGPTDVAVDESGVWVVNRLDRTVSRVDPESGEVVATIEIGNEPRRIAAGEGAVWVTVRAPVE